LARSLSGRPDLIICNSPTYGLDAKTVRFIHELLKKESRRGTAVVLITSDMDELFSCSNRIGVLFNGQIAGLMDRCDATVEKVGKLMLGMH
jgi:simple sugar transport system ATP-binding protein